jgi:hypothetical protein
MEIPEFVWSDIERELNFSPDSTVERGRFRERMDRIIELVDMERARQVRQSMRPFPQGDTHEAS